MGSGWRGREGQWLALGPMVWALGQPSNLASLGLPVFLLQELREEYLVESAARLAGAAAEVAEVQQAVQRAQAPLRQQVPGREAEGALRW